MGGGGFNYRTVTFPPALPGNGGVAVNIASDRPTTAGHAWRAPMHTLEAAVPTVADKAMMVDKEGTDGGNTGPSHEPSHLSGTDPTGGAHGALVVEEDDGERKIEMAPADLPNLAQIVSR